jgi:hypothetical protein
VVIAGDINLVVVTDKIAGERVEIHQEYQQQEQKQGANI